MCARDPSKARARAYERVASRGDAKGVDNCTAPTVLFGFARGERGDQAGRNNVDDMLSMATARRIVNSIALVRHLAASMDPPAALSRCILILNNPWSAAAVAAAATYVHPIGFGYTMSDSARESTLRTALMTSVFVAP